MSYFTLIPGPGNTIYVSEETLVSNPSSAEMMPTNFEIAVQNTIRFTEEILSDPEKYTLVSTSHALSLYPKVWGHSLTILSIVLQKLLLLKKCSESQIQQLNLLKKDIEAVAEFDQSIATREPATSSILTSTTLSTSLTLSSFQEKSSEIALETASHSSLELLQEDFSYPASDEEDSSIQPSTLLETIRPVAPKRKREAMVLEKTLPCTSQKTPLSTEGIMEPPVKKISLRTLPITPLEETSIINQVSLTLEEIITKSAEELAELLFKNLPTNTEEEYVSFSLKNYHPQNADTHIINIQETSLLKKHQQSHRSKMLEMMQIYFNPSGIPFTLGFIWPHISFQLLVPTSLDSSCSPWFIILLIAKIIYAQTETAGIHKKIVNLTEKYLSSLAILEKLCFNILGNDLQPDKSLLYSSLVSENLHIGANIQVSINTSASLPPCIELTLNQIMITSGEELALLIIDPAMKEDDKYRSFCINFRPTELNPHNITIKSVQLLKKNKSIHRKIMLEMMKTYFRYSSAAFTLSFNLSHCILQLKIDQQIKKENLSWFVLLLIAKVIYAQTSTSYMLIDRAFIETSNDYLKAVKEIERKCRDSLLTPESILVTPSLSHLQDYKNDISLFASQIITTKSKDLVALIIDPYSPKWNMYTSFSLKKSLNKEQKLTMITINFKPMAKTNQVRQTRKILNLLKEYLNLDYCPNFRYNTFTHISLKDPNPTQEQQQLFQLLFILKVIYYKATQSCIFNNYPVIKPLFIEVEQALLSRCKIMLPTMLPENIYVSCFNEHEVL